MVTSQSELIPPSCGAQDNTLLQVGGTRKGRKGDVATRTPNKKLRRYGVNTKLRVVPYGVTEVVTPPPLKTSVVQSRRR